MKYKNLHIFAWVARLSVILSTFLLSVGLAMAQPVKPNAEINPTSALSTRERQELDRLREDRRIQQQVQLEANRAFNQTTTLFNVMLATLALLLGGAIAALWLLRRAVIQEVAALVRTHLKEMGDLEGKISHAHQDVQKILQEAENLEADLHNEADIFQQEIGTKRENLSQLLSEVSQSKKAALAELQTQIQEAKQALENLETTFSTELSQLQSDAQQHKSLILQNLEKLSSDFTPELSGIRSDVQAQKDAVLQNLEQSETEFAAGLSQLQANVQQQRDFILQNLEKLSAEFAPELSTIQADVQAQKDTVLQNLEQSETEFAAGLSQLQANV
ncbi:MAG TPA: hypothetical protein DCE56_22215, partial [Cyanobacteria bacterium UBA8553]|nr:hypothetical protein [Cyanobacteria bacterium UBA8553]